METGNVYFALLLSTVLVIWYLLLSNSNDCGAK